MIIVGIAFIIMGSIIFAIDYFNKKQCKETVFGTVVDIYKVTSIRGDGQKRRTLYPIFSYDVDGTIYVKKSSNGSKFCKYKIGDEVEIKYKAENPNKYYVKGSKSNIIISLIWIIIGIVFLFLK